MSIRSPYATAISELTVFLGLIRGLFFLDCAVIIDKNENILVRRVFVSLSALITGAQIA